MITAAADGSSLGNPGPTGWGWYIDDSRWAAGGQRQGTNNIGELLGLLHAIEDHRDVADLVVQADAPDEYKTYLHRSGRTGRAGRSGRVVTLITRQRQRRMTELLERAEIEAPFENARLNDDLIEEIAGRVPTAADLTA